MLYIDDRLPHIQQAKRIHVRRITCYLNRKIQGNKPSAICNDNSCIICNSDTKKAKMSRKLSAILRSIDMKDLVSAQPQKLQKLHEDFEQSCLASNITKRDRKALTKIFNYVWFRDNPFYDAYTLCKNLQIESCIYCNRLYTTTVITTKNKKVIRPTLDHWFTQEACPILALSFYNLIPSCSPCNSSVKHSNPFLIKSHIHPYVDRNITSKYKLRSLYDKSLTTFKVTVEPANTRAHATLISMQIAEIYQHHQSELADLDLLKRKYNKTYLKELGRLLGGSLTEKDVYRIMFGVEYEDDNFHKRPLSKLKKDILTK